jgi:hypothetical protein
MGSKRSEINTFDALQQLVDFSASFLATEIKFFNSLSNEQINTI